MKRLIFVITALFFAIVACTSPKPKGILSEKRMAEVMTEVYAADGYLSILPIDSSRKLLPVLYQNIFDRYGLDSTQFNTNVDYYFGNPVQSEKLFTEVQKRLMRYERDAIVHDSIRHAHERDSSMMAQRLKRSAEQAIERILHVYIDTSMRYDMTRHGWEFFGGLDLGMERTIPTEPVPRRPFELDAIEEAMPGDEFIEDRPELQPEPERVTGEEAQEVIRKELPKDLRPMHERQLQPLRRVRPKQSEPTEVQPE